MMSSTSARKRVSEGVYDESFANPQFEEGRKNVPQAELEHVAPMEKLEEPQPVEQEMATESMDVRSVKNQISQHLQKISDNLNQIFDLTSEIQLEKENIKRNLQNLHT